MPVVAAFLYRDGARVRSVAINERCDDAKDKSEFVWIGIAEPSHEEMQALQHCHGLHELAVEDAINANQLPKVEVFGDQLFVVARTARLEGDRIEYGETAIFVGRSHIITVRHGSPRAHTALREQLEKAPTLLMHGTDYLLHAVLDFIVDGYVPMVDQLEDEVLEMEQMAVDGFLGREEINRIFTLRRELIHFQRILGPMGEVALKLARQDLPCVDADARIYFRDVQDHVRRVQTRVDALRETLTSVFEFSTPSGAAADRQDHPATRLLGGDPRGPDGVRGHLRHEFRKHARATCAIRLLYRRRIDRRGLPVAVHTLPANGLALA